jgi:hypothetical protein
MITGSLLSGGILPSSTNHDSTNGYIIVTGDIAKIGAIDQVFTSNDDPVKVFVGGVITPRGITDNNRIILLSTVQPGN